MSVHSLLPLITPSGLMIHSSQMLIALSRLMWALNTILTTRVYMNLVWLVRKPVTVGDTISANFTQGEPVFRAAMNSQAPVDSYAYTPTFGGSRNRHYFSRSDNGHTFENAESGSDMPVDVCRGR